MECTECKYRKQIPLKRCKHFELGGDKKRKVRVFWSFLEWFIYEQSNFIKWGSTKRMQNVDKCDWTS